LVGRPATDAALPGNGIPIACPPVCPSAGFWWRCSAASVAAATDAETLGRARWEEYGDRYGSRSTLKAGHEIAMHVDNSVLCTMCSSHYRNSMKKVMSFSKCFLF